MITQWFRSPLTRLACLLPVLTWLILSLVLIPTYHEAVSDIEGEVRNAIDEEILGLNQVYQTQGLPGLASAVDARTNDGVDRAALYLLTSSDGSRLAGAVMAWPEAVPLQDRQWFSVPEMRGGTLEGKVFIFVGGDRLMVARRSPIQSFRERLRDRLMLASFLAITTSGLLAAWVLGRYRLRLANIRSKARDILSCNLSHRLEPGKSGDELDQLIREFNQAFDEIEKLMEATRHVSSAIAHDMRRPIAAIRYQLETMSRNPQLPESLQNQIMSLLEQTDESLNTFSALLRLAKLESGSYGPKKDRIALHELVQEVIDTYAPVAAAHQMQFRSDIVPAYMTGDWNLLFLGLQNIFDNAINYGALAIEVRLSIEKAQAFIVIRDHGNGVSESDLPKIFDRFYRASSARTAGGSGIGLALVRAIAEVHEGSVSASNAHPGLAVTLRLPLSRSA